jgi:hypothetical protein
MIKAMTRAKGVDKTIVVSDILFLGGCEAGDYTGTSLGEPIRLEENGYLHMPSRKCMAGSSCNMIKCMNYLCSLGFLTPAEMAQVSYHNPLKLLGLTASIAADTGCKAEPKEAKHGGSGSSSSGGSSSSDSAHRNKRQKTAAALEFVMTVKFDASRGFTTMDGFDGTVRNRTKRVSGATATKVL